MSIILVIYNHTWIMGFKYYAVSENPATIAAGIILSAFCKIALPLFFMISGALLLNREESIRTVLSKRVLRMIIVLILASVLYYLCNTDFSFPIQYVELISQFFTARIHTPLWFLYVYIAFLIGLPFIRPVAKAMDTHKIIFATIIYFLMQWVNYFSVFFSQWAVSSYLTQGVMISGDCVYFALLGHYLENIRPKEEYAASWKYGLLILLSVCLGAGFIYANGTLFGDMMSESAHKLMVCFIAIGVFALIKKLSFQWVPSSKAVKLINTFGGCVFGAYLLEGWTRPLTMNIYNTLEQHIPSLLACWLWVILAAILGLVMTGVLKQIPLVKKLL